MNVTKIGNPDALLAQFRNLMQAGADVWAAAGKVLVQLRDEHRWTLDSILKRLDGAVSRTVLERFEALGRKRLHPRTLLSSSPAMVKIRLLPYNEQEAALDGDVLTLDANGERIRKRPQDMTAAEVTLAYNNDGTVRNIAEQEEIWKRRKRRRGGNICDGRRDGWDPDRETRRAGGNGGMTLDEIKEATPLQLLQDALERAQVALVEARRHLTKAKPNSRKDVELSAALRAVGEVRYAANNGEL